MFLDSGGVQNFTNADDSVLTSFRGNPLVPEISRLRLSIDLTGMFSLISIFHQVVLYLGGDVA